MGITLHLLVGDAYYIWDVLSHDKWYKLSHPVQLIKFSVLRGVEERQAHKVALYIY